jgi:hypothetical protein
MGAGLNAGYQALGGSDILSGISNPLSGPDRVPVNPGTDLSGQYFSDYGTQALGTAQQQLGQYQGAINDAAGASKAAGQYYGQQLQDVGAQAGAAGQSAAAGLRGTGAGAEAVGQSYGDTVSKIAANSAAGLGATGAQLNAQGGAAQDRTVGAPQFNAMNGTLNQAMSASNVDTTKQDKALSQAMPNYDAANQQAAQANLNFGEANQALGQSQNYAQQLAGIENEAAPSAAQAQLQSGLNQAQQSSLAMARSGRGFGGSAAALNQAAVLNANASQQAVNSSAQLRASEVAAERTRQAQNLTGAAGIQQGASGQMTQQQQMAASLGMQKSAMLQQQQDAASNVALGLGAQYGQAGQFQSQLAANTALGVGQQQLGQQQLSSGAALQNASQNDTYGLGLYNLGLNAQESGANLGLEGAVAGAGLGMQGIGMNIGAQQAAGGIEQTGFGTQAGAVGAGGQLELGGYGQAGGLYGTSAGYGLENLGLQGNIETGGLNFSGQHQQNVLNAAAIQAGQNQAAYNSQMGVWGALLGAGGAAMASSDRDLKKDIKPANKELFVPESGQYDKPENADKIDYTAKYNQDPFYGNFTSYEKGPPATPEGFGQGVGISGPNQMTPPPANAAATGPNPMQKFGSGLAAMGGSVQQMGGGGGAINPVTGMPYYQPNLTLSDEREKEAVETVENAPAYSYNYTDPDAMGAAPGRQFGIMAQDLEKTPAGRSVVKQGPNGAKMVDTSRLTMVNTAALNGMQKHINELEALIRSKGKKAA